MAAPLLPAALMVGGGILNNAAGKYFGGRTKFEMTNPADYKDKLVMGDNEASGIRNNLLSSLMGSQAKTNADIGQAAAANRLPEGAALSAMAGTSQGVARGMSNLEPQLQAQQRSSLMRYLNMQQNYDANKMNHNMRNVQGQAAMNQSTLGNLGKLAVLWQAGLLDAGGSV